MSGIFGIYYLDGRPVDPAILAKMSEKLAHRGKDGADTWIQNNLGLGHRMLRTTPESLFEKNPEVHKNGKLVITADARIDNRQELITALDLKNCRREKITDSDLILAAYEKWAEDCTQKLLGDFAFVIWDETRQNLFCARDHFGVKPFYYCMTNHLFVFASEIKALFCAEEVPCTLNETRVAEYLASLFDDTENTFYEQIFRLPPAHYVSICHRKARFESYWSLDPSKELRLESDEEYVDGFREHFTEAVRSRLRCAFPVGCMLSGGLDSSSIACTAKNILSKNGSQKLSTFSAVFNDLSQCDEREYIHPVIGLDGFAPTFVCVDDKSPITDLERIMWHGDEALYAFNLNINWSIYKIAEEKGIRVILDGFDGDSTVSHGVGYLSDIARQNRWLTLVSEVNGFSKNFQISATKMLFNYFLQYGIKNKIPKKLLYLSGMTQKIFRLANKESHRSPRLKLVNPQFADQLRLADHQKKLNKLKDYSSVPKSERGSHFLTLTRGVMPYTLEVLNKTASAFSIEPRFPFWDKRLVEYCLSLPPEQKIKNGWTRLILRRAMEGIIPNKVQWRREKSNLGPYFSRGLLRFEQKLLKKVVLNRSGDIEKYVDISYLRKVYSRFLSMKASDDAMLVWKATMLSEWLNQTKVASPCDALKLRISNEQPN